MAESTPGNLGSAFGGWAAGRAAGNRRLDQSVDRLEETINKFSDSLDRLIGSVNSTTSRAGGGGSGGPTQGGGRANGGGFSFGALMGLTPPGAHQAGAGGGGGDHRADGPAQILPPGNGGHRAPGAAVGTPSMGRVARNVGAAGMAATAVYTANHFSNQVAGPTLAAMYAGGPNWNAAYQAGARGNFTAHGDADAARLLSLMGQRSGYTMGSQGWNQMRGSAMSYSAVNPTISNTQAVGAQMSLSTAGSYNRMAALGINPIGAAGRGDPRMVARQILTRMGSQRVRTKEQAFAAFGPSGSATLTLDSYVANGFLPPESRQVVESEMRNILLAQVKGMNYSQYNRAANTANTSGSSRDRLEAAGIAANTLVQSQYRVEGKARESEAETIGGFAAGVKSATTAVGAFRDALNGILSIPGVGSTVGGISGITGQIPFVGGLLRRMSGPLGGEAGKLLAMADGGVLPGYTPGRDVHKFYSPTGGRLDLSGGEGILIPQATKALGGPQGIKSINDQFRGQSFADGGVFKNPSAKVTMDGKAVSAIAAAQIKLAEKISGINFHVMQGGFGGSHYAASKTSHNYPGVVDVSPGTIAAEKILRQVGFAAWARNIKGRVSVGSGAHVHAVSLLDPGDANSPQVTGSWKRHNDGNGGPTNGDPAPHYAWVSNLKKRLGATNLTGLGGGGGTGGGGGGNNNGGASSTGATAGGGDTGGLAVAGGAGGGYLGGTFSETAALGLMGGGGGSGMFGGESNAGNGGTNTTGSPGGPMGEVGLQGGPGNVRIGSLNMFVKNGPRQWSQDLTTASRRADVLGLQEARGLGRKWFKDHNWGYYTNPLGDTGVAWNSGRYKAVQRHVLDLADSVRYGGGHLRSAAAYVLLQDKKTGTKFWVISSHPQAHRGKIAGATGIQRQQMQQLGGLYKRLRSSGLPVFSVGDFNNSHPLNAGAAPGAAGVGTGIDHLLFGGAKNNGYGHMDVNSDHPFVFGNFHIAGDAATGRSGTYRPSAGVEQWRDEVIFAMRKAGISPTKANVDRTLVQMKSESHGDPNIVNKWDSNWKAGHPSVGLMQVIEGTFNAYAGPYKNRGPKKYGVSTDPIANIYASLKYATARYGSLKNAYQGHGYDIGEWNIRDDKDARVHKGEMILPSKISDIVRNELSAPGIKGNLGRHSGGGAKVVFEKGAIQVNLGGGSVGYRQAKQAGRMVVDAIMEDQRIKALAEGD